MMTMVTRMIDRARLPLYRNALVLMVNSGITAGLGFVFWALTASSLSLIWLSSSPLLTKNITMAAKKATTITIIHTTLTLAIPRTERFIILIPSDTSGRAGPLLETQR